ncbi:MAG: Crp/Fnr family transcriptional regulator [Cyanobacteria bacterium P01_F01_bin.42]
MEPPTARRFKRREFIPLRENVLWQIRAGAVHTSTVSEEGAIISLGFWGLGDIVGQPVSCIQPFQVECLMDVEVTALMSYTYQDLNRVMLSHVHQMQELLRIRHGHIRNRMEMLLRWLADRFGAPTDQGQLIQLRLTHQDIADAIGSTRVTVTRTLQDLEESNVISWFQKRQIVLHELH